MEKRSREDRMWKENKEAQNDLNTKYFFIIFLIQMDVSGLPPIPTGSFW
jgi:hypothetical protein